MSERSNFKKGGFFIEIFLSIIILSIFTFNAFSSGFSGQDRVYLSASFPEEEYDGELADLNNVEIEESVEDVKENGDFLADDSPLVSGFEQENEEEGIKKEAMDEEIVINAHQSLIDNPYKYLPEGSNYARLSYSTPVYYSIESVLSKSPFTYHGGGAVWINIKESRVVGDKEYYYINWGVNDSGWISSESVSFNDNLSTLRGVKLSAYGDKELAMVYTNVLNVRSEPGVLDEDTLVGQINKYYYISVEESRIVGGREWYRIGEGQWIDSSYVRNFVFAERPEAVGEDEKWIEVNLREQIAVAHIGDTPIYATLTSTGRAGHETVRGLFRPWLKTNNIAMRGARFSLNYDLADVPWVYFFHGSYGFHGTYWHNEYGVPQSAGCVNLSPYDSHWFFNWSLPVMGEEHEIRPKEGDNATWVYVH